MIRSRAVDGCPIIATVPTGTGRQDPIVVNPLTLSTLRLLSSSEFLSGEEIAARLGVTRATVWNAIRDAGARGVEIERSRGHGYRLVDAPVWLDAKAVEAGLASTARHIRVRVVEEVASTNTTVLAEAASGAPSGTVLVAESQVGGRGRRGRTWVSTLGGALTFSLLWRFDQGVAALSGLSLVCGLACAEGLEAAGARDVRVKWPNDLQHAGRKLGGILIELQGDALGPSAAVIGIGINVRLPDAVAREVNQPAIDAVSLGATPDRNRLLAEVLSALATRIETFSRHGFAPIEAAFRARHALHDHEVTIALPDGRTVVGRVEGTDPDGALRVRTASGAMSFHGGEVSVRGTPGP